MVDFLMISTRPGKRGIVEIYPRFIIKKSSDLMIRGGDFYAIWLEDKNLWSTDEEDVIQLIDRELDEYYKENKSRFEVPVKVLHLWDAETGMIDSWHRYCQKQMRDSFHMLDEKIIFSNTDMVKKDYASKRLSYPLEKGETTAYDKLMSTLYSDEERHKIEWAIGSIVNGDSKKIQKFLVLYGAAGTGKSTVLNIIQQLFEGYYSVFDAKSLGSSTNSFALEAFKNNPLVAIQHDGDLSRIEDNTRLNSLVSHETMIVNEKYAKQYQNNFKCFLFMGTNSPVKITDSKSGLMRRLIDVTPTGDKVPVKEYKTLVKKIDFELGAIAWHCKQVYEENPGYYDDYIPISMLGASNDFYNFMLDSYFIFKKDGGVTLKIAWEMYKNYCDDAKVYYPLSQRLFKEELKSYFFEYSERYTLADGTRVRSYYSKLREDKFGENNLSNQEQPISSNNSSIVFLQQESVFDKECCNLPAQYGSSDEKPISQWKNVTTTLASIDTSKLHYVKVPINHIVIDFDIPDENGEKSFERNLEEASKWPPTYAELSKSGKGIHLHYIYNGDPTKLSRVYAEHIEIKVFNGNSSLRRKLTLCNNLPIATISSGLPLQEDKKSKTDGAKIKSQKKLFEMIERNLKKEIHPGTKPSCDFIYKIVEDAYNDGLVYKIPEEMKKRIMKFAKNSTHQSDYCVKLMKKMHYESQNLESEMDKNNQKIRDFVFNILTTEADVTAAVEQINEYLLNIYNSGKPYDVRDLKNDLISFVLDLGKGADQRSWCLSVVEASKYYSDEPMEFEEKSKAPIVFYDIEVFPNLLLIVWKKKGKNQPKIRWFNPTPAQIEELLRFRLIGFNCRRYDNHLIYAAMMGFTNEQLYELSQRIIEGNKNAFFVEAYNISYTDIYDFASAGNKKSLKKLEIEMGIHHHELGLPWDQPVPEDKWPMVGEYCDDDVDATEAAFDYLKADWTARQILAGIAGMTVNDTTNTLTQRIIFGKNREPQGAFNYRDLSKPVKSMDDDMMRFLSEACPDMMSMTHGTAHSLLPYFPGYKYDFGKSIYRGEEVGEGGYVYAEPGIYTNVALLDIASMHPHSVIAECLFGVEHTTTFRNLVLARVYIKHEQWSKVEKLFGGKLKPFIEMVKNGEMTSKDLANALKTAINSVYGLTSASFTNPFRDKRNKDNIVAKRGALFMVDLKHEVQKRGFTVAHIKTDSIKIPNATPEIIQFVMDFGKQYGYTFEHEATYERMCLVNDAVYIAKYDNGEWTATGTQFQVPYVFKTLFSHEPISFNDLCETKSVTSSLYLDMNEGLPSFTDKEAKELANLDKIFPDLDDEQITRYNTLVKKNDASHNYKFVGRVGQFCPIKDGAGGGLLMREKDGKYYSATGTKGYRWLESEDVKLLGLENQIDMTYYNKLVDEAVRTISEYGDFEWFAA